MPQDVNKDTTEAAARPTGAVALQRVYAAKYNVLITYYTALKQLR